MPNVLCVAEGVKHLMRRRPGARGNPQHRLWRFRAVSAIITSMKILTSALLALACAFTARAGIHTETFEYKHGDTSLEGHLAYDDAINASRPAVLIVHQW